MPSFSQVLEAVDTAYRERPEQVNELGARMAEHMRETAQLAAGEGEPAEPQLTAAVASMRQVFDPEWGGFGRAPKFPPASAVEFLLRMWRRTGEGDPLEIATATLDGMALGGMYDVLGGGFSRYSVDEQWLVPHFEKMLYDNAQLASLYLHGWLATDDPEYRRVCEETLDYVLREMTHASGGFFSAQDADSEGVEGKFFVWTPEEIAAALDDPEMTRAALAYWGVDKGPNFEGQSILFVPREPSEVAEDLGLTEARLEELIAAARARLYAVRDKRVHPGLDDKVLASWNGLALAAFAEAGRVLGRADYTAAAVRNADFVVTQMKAGERLVRSWKDGQAKIKGYLEDYAMVGAGLLTLYEATFDRRWLDESRRLAEQALALFWEEGEGIFFDTGIDHEALVVRPRNLFDNAVPCGTSVAIEWLLKLAVFFGEERYEAVAIKALRPMADLMTRYPSGFGRYLSALDFHLGPVAEVALVWPDRADAAALTATAFQGYRPNRLVVGAPANSPAAQGLPLLAERPAVDGKPTAYVCRRYVCQLPVTDPTALAGQLDAGV
jgi:uncharacterized protein YyaL (SSP411 family)